MKNDLKELHRLANVMDYEDWREEIQYRLTGKLKRVKNDVIINNFPIPVVRLSLFNEVYNEFVSCEDNDEFTRYLNKNTNEA